MLQFIAEMSSKDLRWIPTIALIQQTTDKQKQKELWETMAMMP